MKTRYQDIYHNIYNSLGIKHLLYKNAIWVNSRGLIQSIGPAIQDYSLNRSEAEFLMKKLKGLAVVSTDGFNLNNLNDTHKCKEYYAVINDEFIPIELLSSNTRSKIRRGMKKCKVEKVSIDYVARNGYAVYIKAYKRYNTKNPEVVDEERFYRNLIRTAKWPEIHDYWGVFCGNKFVAYAHVLLFSDIEASYTYFKFDPDYLRFYISYILIQEMNKYYLGEKFVSYVNDGFRNLFHKTTFQEFLIEKFHFKKAFINLSVYENLLIFPFVSIAQFFSKRIGKIYPEKLNAYLRFRQIAKLCQKYVG